MMMEMLMITITQLQMEGECNFIFIRRFNMSFHLGGWQKLKLSYFGAPLSFLQRRLGRFMWHLVADGGEKYLSSSGSLFVHAGIP